MPDERRIQIYEVGPRDGLQNETRPIPAATKIEYIAKLIEAGLTRIEATSFVRPGVIPQLSDAAEVYPAARKQLDAAQNAAESDSGANSNVNGAVRLIALAPNRKGMENALAAGIQEAAIFTAASESFTRKNINASIEESLARFEEVMQLAREAGVPVRGYVSTVVECPYEGRIKPERVQDVTKQLFDLGCYQVSLGETIGVAVPEDIRLLLDVLRRDFAPELLAGHFHDTRGTALANVFAALEYGLRAFDASSGGLGGCPYAPGAAGNLATEDLVYALERSGYSTGVNLEKLAAASELVGAAIGRPLASRVYQAVQKSVIG